MVKDMPKRVNHIFKEKIKFKNMLKAYERAAKGRKQNKEVILFEMDLANNLTKILKDIYNGTHEIGEYRRFIVYELKERVVWSLPFADRIMHQWYVEEFINYIFNLTKGKFSSKIRALNKEGEKSCKIVIENYLIV